MSHVMCHVSNVTVHVSHVTCHFFYFNLVSFAKSFLPRNAVPAFQRFLTACLDIRIILIKYCIHFFFFKYCSFRESVVLIMLTLADKGGRGAWTPTPFLADIICQQLLKKSMENRKCGNWHLTTDTWHITPDTWQVKNCGGWSFF